MGSAIYAQAQAEQQAAAQEGAAGAEDGAPQGDDVVDAEIVDEEGPSDTHTREGGAA